MKAPVEDIDHIGQRLLQRFVFSVNPNWEMRVTFWSRNVNGSDSCKSNV
jgi:hypothetical protein